MTEPASLTVVGDYGSLRFALDGLGAGGFSIASIKLYQGHEPACKLDRSGDGDDVLHQQNLRFHFFGGCNRAFWRV